jgi:UDPglucose 6-dehydrogenase
MKSFDCAVIGDWHLAFCTAVGLASTGKRILFLNPKGKESPWREFPKCPVTEPGLEDLQSRAITEGRLDYSNDLASTDWSAPYVWLAIDTPVDENDKADTNDLKESARVIASRGQKLEAFAMNSQVPLGFCASLEKEFGLPVCYLPENLRLGKGLETFLQADRTVIGASDLTRAESFRQWMTGFKTEFLICNLETAEMIKHATNAFLATSISFANELARIGESLGVDSQLLAKGLKMDKRIGPAAYVAPGLGFAGGTLPRDLRILQGLGQSFRKPTRLVDAVLAVNEATTDAVYDSVAPRLNGKSPKALVLGYTYKADTDTLRRSLSIDLARRLMDSGVSVYGYDPTMNGKDISAIAPYLQHRDSEESLVDLHPDVILVMTARASFRTLDFSRFSSTSTLVFDAVGLYRSADIVKQGVDYKRLWEKEVSA